MFDTSTPRRAGDTPAGLVPVRDSSWNSIDKEDLAGCSRRLRSEVGRGFGSACHPPRQYDICRRDDNKRHVGGERDDGDLLGSHPATLAGPASSGSGAIRSHQRVPQAQSAGVGPGKTAQSRTHERPQIPRRFGEACDDSQELSGWGHGVWCELCDLDLANCIHGLRNRQAERVRSAALLASPRGMAHFEGCPHKGDDLNQEVGPRRWR